MHMRAVEKLGEGGGGRGVGPGGCSKEGAEWRGFEEGGGNKRGREGRGEGG